MKSFFLKKKKNFYKYKKKLSIMVSLIDNSKEDLKKELEFGISYDNTQKIKNILDYATKNKIILELNEKDEDGIYTLLMAILRNNTKIVQLQIGK